MTASTLASRAPRPHPAPGDTRPRLLFLSQTLPYPPDGGANIRTHHLLRILAGAFDVTALCFFRRRERPTAAHVRESVAALGRMANVEAFAIPQEHDRLRYLADHARSVVQGKAYTHYAYGSRRFERSLERVLATTAFDLVHVDAIDLAAYLGRLDVRRVSLNHQNVESMLLRRWAAVERVGWRRWYYELQADRVEALERRWCGRVALNIVVSPDDADGLAALVPEARIAVVPNGVDTDYFTPGSGRDEGIVCVGGINGFANRDGLDFLCADIMPRLGPVPGGVRWVGRATEEERRNYGARFGIELTGYVDDVRPLVRDAACYVVPLRAGGGTRVKILDAWAMGKAVVSTSIGCEGLDARDGENILVRDTAEGFAEAVCAVLGDAALRRRLGAAARRTVLERYGWNVIGSGLVSSYRGLLDASAD